VPDRTSNALLNIRCNPNGSLTGIIRARDSPANHQVRRAARNGSLRCRDARLVMRGYALWTHAWNDGYKVIPKGLANCRNFMRGADNAIEAICMA
jgi:hypothetical protein